MTLRRGFQGRQGVSVTRLLMGLTAVTCFAVAGVTTHRLDSIYIAGITAFVICYENIVS